jgi:hypothetical protein
MSLKKQIDQKKKERAEEERRLQLESEKRRHELKEREEEFRQRFELPLRRQFDRLSLMDLLTQVQQDTWKGGTITGPEVEKGQTLGVTGGCVGAALNFYRVWIRSGYGSPGWDGDQEKPDRLGRVEDKIVVGTLTQEDGQSYLLFGTQSGGPLRVVDPRSYYPLSRERSGITKISLTPSEAEALEELEQLIVDDCIRREDLGLAPIEEAIRRNLEQTRLFCNRRLPFGLRISTTQVRRVWDENRERRNYPRVFAGFYRIVELSQFREKSPF